jgi:hypothetical protein
MIGGAILIVAVLLLVFWTVLQAVFPLSPMRVAVTPVFTVIPAPSATVPGLPTTVAGVTLTPTAVPVGELGIGAYVQINGTGGDGLRLRSGPGKDNAPLFLGMESEVFLIKDGPKQADGYNWWFLLAPYDDNRKGWAVENYLSVIHYQTSTPTP